MAPLVGTSDVVMFPWTSPTREKVFCDSNHFLSLCLNVSDNDVFYILYPPTLLLLLLWLLLYLHHHGEQLGKHCFPQVLEGKLRVSFHSSFPKFLNPSVTGSHQTQHLPLQNGINNLYIGGIANFHHSS